ncbi:carbon-nitrogen hydrolase family protein [Pseudoalteromonas xiamenensis]|uniref:carbon-nitrogen hydrolase family protein n=1 Tax=Pseudoalteromonas xiamenensis TaxID=882626 RepID=UPI0027E4161B|nr:carbon-nitrogen hydrolase family protein [Pseudoalteromonas xiamenensis]WMN59462.1 carbon-nitrogen hydrolase family protein [Pseudoalteromonas xiamenensis]
MKQTVTIGLAQLPVARGDISENLSNHLNLIETAAQRGCDLLVFPELSLTGYELDLAESLALALDSPHLNSLSETATSNKINVLVGAPLWQDDSRKPTIGAIVCFSDGHREFYSKQYLHDGEEQYCSSGDHDYAFTLNGFKMAVAVCADFCASEHSARAKAQGADLYLVSALISEKGFSVDSELLSAIAERNKMPTLLCNHISKTGGWQAHGHNSIWTAEGTLAFSSNHKDGGIVCCTITRNNPNADFVLESHWS